MDWTWGWTAVRTVATCVLAAGIVVAIWQIIETRRSTNTQLKAARFSTNVHVAIEMFRELRSVDNLNLLQYIYSLKPERFGSLTKNQKSEIERAIVILNMLGILVVNDVIDEILAAESLAGPTALRDGTSYTPMLEKRDSLEEVTSLSIMKTLQGVALITSRITIGRFGFFVRVKM